MKSHDNLLTLSELAERGITPEVLSQALNIPLEDVKAQEHQLKPGKLSDAILKLSYSTETVAKNPELTALNLIDALVSSKQISLAGIAKMADVDLSKIERIAELLEICKTDTAKFPELRNVLTLDEAYRLAAVLLIVDRTLNYESKRTETSPHDFA